MVTAELAVLLPSLVLLLVLGLRAVAAGVAELGCVDAARTAARSAARGDPPDVAKAAGAALAPPGARIELRLTGRSVVVEVHASAELFPGLRLPLRAKATALRESAP
jgi:hypothetical protein